VSVLSYPVLVLPVLVSPVSYPVLVLPVSYPALVSTVVSPSRSRECSRIPHTLFPAPTSVFRFLATPARLAARAAFRWRRNLDIPRCSARLVVTLPVVADLSFDLVLGTDLLHRLKATVIVHKRLLCSALHEESVPPFPSLGAIPSVAALGKPKKGCSCKGACDSTRCGCFKDKRFCMVICKCASTCKNKGHLGK